VVQANRSYDSDPHRHALAEHGIDTEIARRYTGRARSLDKTRWVVNLTIAWLH